MQQILIVQSKLNTPFKSIHIVHVNKIDKLFQLGVFFVVGATFRNDQTAMTHRLAKASRFEQGIFIEMDVQDYLGLIQFMVHLFMEGIFYNFYGEFLAQSFQNFLSFLIERTIEEYGRSLAIEIENFERAREKLTLMNGEIARN